MWHYPMYIILIIIYLTETSTLFLSVRYDISLLSEAFFWYWIEHRERIFIFGTVIHTRTIALPPLSLPLGFQMSDSRRDLFLPWWSEQKNSRTYRYLLSYRDRKVRHESLVFCVIHPLSFVNVNNPVIWTSDMSYEKYNVKI